MKANSITVILGAALVVASCSSAEADPAASGPANPGAATSPTPTAAPPVDDPAPEEPPGGIEAVQIDGAWVFRHEPAGGMDALHSGAPEIVDGCLVVDGAVVVWHADRMAEAAAAVAAARAGARPPLLIAGGGLSLDEGADPDQIPEVIAARCAATAVWFGAP